MADIRSIKKIPDRKFKKGDEVELSGISGAIMLIEHVEDSGFCACVWHDDFGVPQERQYHEDILNTPVSVTTRNTSESKILSKDDLVAALKEVIEEKKSTK